MGKRSRSYKKHLSEALNNKKEALLYLKTCFDDDDHRIFLIALKDVIDSRDITIVALAKDTGISRENIHRMLSMRGNPNWQNINKILAVLGYSFNISYKKAS